MLKHIFAVLTVAILPYLALDIIKWMGYFQQLYHHSPEKCFRVQGIEHGSEDIQALPNGMAFISSGLRFKDTAVYQNRVGRFYLFDLNKPDSQAEELAIKADKGYTLKSPHGISLWTDPKTGEVYLYAICHHHPQEVIDKFQFDASSKTLIHLHRFKDDPNFHKMNDLTVVGEDQFYYTNFFYGYDNLEIPLRLHWGSVGFFNGSSATLVAKGLFIPNGLIISKDARFLYVAHFGDEEICVYKRNNDNSLELTDRIKLGTKPDNLDVDLKTGDLWVGAHPLAYQVVKHSEDPTAVCPSQILKIQMSSEGKAVKIEEIYSNDGSQLTAASVAVPYQNGILIGSISSHALYCELE